MYAILNDDVGILSNRGKVLKSLARVFETFNASNGARIEMLSTLDAVVLYNLTFQAEYLADQALSDRDASIEEIGYALRLKFALAQTRIYLLKHDDWKEILRARGFDNDKWQEIISPIIAPIIEGHLSDGTLSKDDLAEGLLG